MIKKILHSIRAITKIQVSNITKKIIPVSFVCIVSVFFLASNCSEDGGDGTPYSIVESITTHIEADIGGTINTTGGISLIIPPSALPNDTNVVVQKLSVSFEPEKKDSS